MRNTKNKILTASEKVFNKSGYTNTSIDKLAVAANVSKMTFYKYFPDKETLILEVLGLRKEAFVNDIKQVSADTCVSRKKLKNIFNYYSEWIGSPDFNGCMFARAVVELGSWLGTSIDLY